ncbi:MAG: asparagine synthase (glutamine-hydrolyzing) [Pseudomonadota bacterium]|nr:asparagine synthase (glutamine-hydrolyzing) [Pseudomonadota bacterium]
MCGIAGFLDTPTSPSSAAQLDAPLDRMGDAIAHRGPDDCGAWHDADVGIGLAHRRLAILDLSAAGHQPMHSPSGRYVLVFNGEIYNHLTLRGQLGAENWHGHSDTETLLAGFAAWGIEATLKRAVGMFALAVWDRQNRTLTLARDRLGEKPLYYGWQGEIFLFGSELKALRAHPAFAGEVDRAALDLFLRRGYVPAPHSIYRGINKLPPGTLLTLGGRDAAPRPYWTVVEARRAGRDEPLPADEGACLDRFESLLRESITGQMVADVPLGAFLSGGIDSSLVVALMQSISARPVRTFTIGFAEQGYDEAGHARAVAAHLGTQHTELYVSPQQAMAVIPRLPTMYDEPFADASQIPTFLVSEMARRQVTVCLSGDGGDELFAGYTRYFWTAAVLRRTAGLPGPLRRFVGRRLAALSPAALDRAFAALSGMLPAHWRYANAGDKLGKLADILAARSIEAACRDASSFWKGEQGLVAGLPAALEDALPETALADIENRMMELDQTGYLPDDILAKVDRAAMAVSLETRIPLLDHRVVEFAWRVPPALKIRDGRGKWLLRQLLYRHVPQTLIDRPKMGFSVPIDNWLRGPLRDWAEALLDPVRLANEGWLSPEAIRRMWQQHLEGRRNAAGELWSVLMFQAWLEQGGGQ